MTWEQDVRAAGDWLRKDKSNRKRIELRATPTTSSTGGLVVESLEGVSPQGVDWLWSGRIPLGAVTILAGREGGGKSALSLGLVASVSRGDLDGALYGQPVNAAIITFEDAVANTIVPRLLAANADLRRIRRIRAEGDVFSLTDHIEDLGANLRAEHARLLVIDPFVAALAVGQVDSHRAQDVRRALAPLAELAEELSLAVLAVFHLNKSTGTDVLTRVSGSGAFTQFARSVLAFGRPSPDAEPDDPERVLVHAKCNLGREQPALEYRIEPRLVDTDEGGRIETNYADLIGESTVRAHEMLSEAGERGESDHAWEVLQDVLGDGGWHPSAEVKAQLKAVGIAERTAQRVAQKNRVEMARHGSPKTYWRLNRATVSDVARTTAPTHIAPPIAPGSRQPPGANVETPLLSEKTTTTTPPTDPSRQPKGAHAREGVAPIAPTLQFDAAATPTGAKGDRP